MLKNHEVRNKRTAQRGERKKRERGASGNCGAHGPRGPHGPHGPHVTRPGLRPGSVGGGTLGGTPPARDVCLGDALALGPAEPDRPGAGREAGDRAALRFVLGKIPRLRAFALKETTF